MQGPPTHVDAKERKEPPHAGYRFIRRLPASRLKRKCQLWNQLSDGYKQEDTLIRQMVGLRLAKEWLEPGREPNRCCRDSSGAENIATVAEGGDSNKLWKGGYFMTQKPRKS